MTVLYVTQPGAEVRKHGERLRIRHRDEVLTDIPLRDVERVVLLGPVQLSASAVQALLERAIPVIFGSSKGRYHGTLSSGQGNTELLMRQVDLYRDAEYRLHIARSIIAAKIRHQRSLLRRQARNHPDADVSKAADQIANLIPRLENVGSISEAMGFEGQASALYFGAFGNCLRHEDIQFTHRNRRPPRDPVNALLSLGYMLITGESVGALASLNLHLGLGFLHEIVPNRPSLALDLVELFRQPVVDRLALSLFNRRIFSTDDFHPGDNGGVRLTEDGFKRYLLLYERTMTTPFQQLDSEAKRSFRDTIILQTQAMRNAIRDAVPWEPISFQL